jgi:hypothetical protein
MQCGPVWPVDASGALEVTIRENAVTRMNDHGITPINWTTVAAELQRNWSLDRQQRQSPHAKTHQFGAIRTASGNLRLYGTAWWTWEDSNF